MSRAAFRLAMGAALVALLVLVGLGTWQMERRAWKEDLVAMVRARTAQAPAPVPARAHWADLTPAQDEYRPVVATGTFDHGRETLIYAVLSDARGPYHGPGYWVITPLLLADGAVVLVNRGFVPQDRRDPASRQAGQVEGPVTVTGLLRFAEDPSWFVPDNDPARDAWYRRVPGQIAAARGLSGAALFLIDADATPNPGGLPVGGETRLSFPNRHLEYALTWYGLAATLVGVGAAFAIARRRGRV